MIDLHDSIVKVFEIIVEDATVTDLKAETSKLLKAICSFDFVVMLHIMKTSLSKSVVLSEALQRKDQDILNAMTLLLLRSMNCKK